MARTTSLFHWLRGEAPEDWDRLRAAAGPRGAACVRPGPPGRGGGARPSRSNRCRLPLRLVLRRARVSGSTARLFPRDLRRGGAGPGPASPGTARPAAGEGGGGPSGRRRSPEPPTRSRRASPAVGGRRGCRRKGSVLGRGDGDAGERLETTTGARSGVPRCGRGRFRAQPGPTLGHLSVLSPS